MEQLNLKSFGAKGDGITDNTQAFLSALKTLKDCNGGTLLIEKGIWCTGPFEIFSNTTIIIEEEAVISFIPEPQKYNPVFTRWEGVECYAMHPCVFSTGQENIKITGKGCIDGNGKLWWDMLKEKRNNKQSKPETSIECKLAQLNPEYKSQPGGGGGRNIQFLRPPLIQFINCKNIIIESITVSNSPFWTIHPVYCETLTISGVSINNPHNAPNTDGIDIDSCCNVLVENCFVQVGDDGIALKSGSGQDGIKVNKPTCNVIIKNCTVGDGHGGVVIGSETAAGIQNLMVEHCYFNKTDRGIRIKTRRGRGGNIANLVFKNINMESNLCPIAINMYYRCGAEFQEKLFSTQAIPINEQTPSIKNIEISNIIAHNCKASAGFIVGLPESPIENLTIKNSEFYTDESSDVSSDESEMFLGIKSVDVKSFRIINVKNNNFSNVTIEGPKENFIYT